MYGYPEGGITVKIAEGDYYMTSSAFSLNASDSGQDGAPIVWQPWNEGDKVRFIGGMKIDASEFEIDEDGLGYYTYSTGSPDTFAISSMPVIGNDAISLSGFNKTFYYPLLVDGNYKTLARYPNDGYDTVATVVSDSGTTYTGFEFTPSEENRLNSWRNEPNLCVQGYWGADWADLGTPASVTERGTIVTTAPSTRGVLAGQRYFVYNALCELDTPEEYYIDNSTGTIHLYSDSGINGDVIIGTNTDSILSISNAENIIVRDIEFVGGRKNGVYIYGCSNITIEDCTINGFNNYGIYTNNMTNSNISGCTITNTGAGGIRLHGGDFENQIPANNVITNNIIHDFSQVNKTYSPAVAIRGYANTVTKNTMYNGDHEAITVTGNDNTISYNEIYNVVREAGDMGAIYVGKNKALRGNVITNNYIHDIATTSSNTSGVQAIFLDDLADGYTVTNNIFANINGRGVKLAGGRDNNISNNIFINCSVSNVLVTAIGIVNPDKYIEQINNDTVITSGAYKESPYNKYPHLADTDFSDLDYSAGTKIPVVGVVVGSYYPAWMYPMYNNVSGNYTYGTTTDIEFSTYNNELTNITDSDRKNTFSSSSNLNKSDFKNYAGGDYSYGDIDISTIGANK